ncbi:DUF4328 domain-containing protein [Kitasatospora sp. NBC_00240]|uniref:DUF4328 domain-containing protein n=1 Tax=Kitasatospora sp. NBC_00240 TaxID=2903567 RepID=UPI002251245B|nr:DUF4328 domain-containing protein [Kitasatospora sp. NBC_00240]MCX5208832.1 DUF4328 domain-containing protein [Kitasatospora sp. NBC_00240]
MDSTQQSNPDKATGAGAGVGRRRPVTGWAAAVTLLVSLAIVREVVVSAGNWRNYQLVHDYLNGAATDADLVAADGDALTALTTSSLLSFLVWGAAGVAFIVWLWRVRTNAESVSGRDAHRRSRIWVIGSWITPVVSFWYPYQIVADIWRVSTPRRPVSHALVKAWWAFFLLAEFVKPIQWRAAEAEWETEGDLLTNANMSVLLTLLFLVAGVLLILIVRRVTAWQNQAWDLAGGAR